MPEVFEADLIPEHHRFWNATTIQVFWAGTWEKEFPNQIKLFAELSKILVYLLTEKTKRMIDYLRCAHYSDSGQAAPCAKSNCYPRG